MKPEFVYLLSDYDEHGAEHVQATLYRGELPRMLSARIAAYDANNQAEALATLEKLLKRPDTDLVAGSTREDAPGSNAFDLMSGWGGIQLHIVPLSERADK